MILRALAKKITWWEAAEILGVSARTMRRCQLPLPVNSKCNFGTVV